MTGLPSGKILWLTGNTGAGKTTLAYQLKNLLGAVVLDGDELRASISTDLGFGREDRNEHNMRVARLALVISRQGLNVAVSVIAPFKSTRDEISALANPVWIYVTGGKVGPDTPYEVPENPHVTVNPSKESVSASVDKIAKHLGKSGLECKQ